MRLRRGLGIARRSAIHLDHGGCDAGLLRSSRDFTRPSSRSRASSRVIPHCSRVASYFCKIPVIERFGDAASFVRFDEIPLFSDV